MNADRTLNSLTEIEELLGVMEKPGQWESIAREVGLPLIDEAWRDLQRNVVRPHLARLKALGLKVMLQEPFP